MTRLSDLQWQGVVSALGQAEADAWRQRNGMEVEGMDDEELPAIDDLEPNFRLGVPANISTPATNQAPATGGLSGLYEELGASQQRARQQRMQLLQEATEALKARRMGPDLSEKLYAISAALTAPTRTKGFAGMMGNLMPVMQQMRAAERTGEQQREDAMLALRQKYLEAETDSELEAIKNRISIAKIGQQGGGMRVSADAFGNRFNTRTGFDVPKPAHIQALLQNPQRTQEFDLKFGPGAAERILTEYGAR